MKSNIFLFLLILTAHVSASANDGGQTYAGPTSFSQAMSTGEFRLNAANAAGNLNKLATFLTDQLTHNRDQISIKDSRVAVTSFVNLDNLRETNKIGAALAELLMHKLQISGFKVVDFKATGMIVVSPSGDYVFSRNPADLRNEYNIHYFLSGTLTKTQEGVVVNARLIDAKSSLVVSSAQGFIPSRDARKLLNEYADVEQECVVVGRQSIPDANLIKLK